MTWVCCRCFVFNSSLNEHCLLCLVKAGITVSKVRFFEDNGFDNQLVAWTLETDETKAFRIFNKERNNMATLTNEEIDSNPNMNSKEKMFAKFFASEKQLVSSMDDGSLKAHIEELQSIAFEARARLSASDDEARERGAKKKRDKGFQTSVASDDFTSETINNIQDRQKKMSKTEKEIERLVGMGIDRKDAENMYRASTVVAIKKQGVQAVVDDLTGGIKNIVNSIVNSTPEEKKAFSNPFAPKTEEVKVYPEPTEESLKRGEDLNDIRLSEVLIEAHTQPTEEDKPKPTFNNPFAKK